MRELAQLIPDPQILLNLQPEELAGKMLFLFRKQLGNRKSSELHFVLSNRLNDLWRESYLPNDGPPYPSELKNQINLAIAEAWGWLVAQSLLVPLGASGGTDSYLLGRRALKFQDETEFAAFCVSRMLQKDGLHPRIASDVWSAFLRGNYSMAVFQAMKEVEVYAREVAKLPEDLLGTDLMRKAFNVPNGPLTDPLAHKAEQQARSDLFAGAIGSYKNAHSHRRVHISDPQEAIEIIMMANHLMRIIDARK